MKSRECFTTTIIQHQYHANIYIFLSLPIIKFKLRCHPSGTSGNYFHISHIRVSSTTRLGNLAQQTYKYINFNSTLSCL